MGEVVAGWGVGDEEVVLAREPITDANHGRTTAGGDLTQEDHEVTLHEERVVHLISGHINPELGKQKLRELTADDVDKFLLARASHVSTRTLRLMHSVLARALRHAQARDKVKRNVVVLCDIPTALDGRPSKALTLKQVEDVLAASESSPLHDYIVLSLLIGARPEELRPLTWDHVDLDGN